MTQATIARLLAHAARELADTSDSPRLDAEVLLGQATGMSRASLFAWPERIVDQPAVEAFNALLSKRLAGEPVAYLVGCREFWARSFMVTPDVLIPRPETELLVEIALGALQSQSSRRVLDLGTGSGVLAITLAAELRDAVVTAVDSSPSALAVARANGARLGVANVAFVRGSWFEGLETGERFDLIVSNPPYIADDDPHLAQGDLRFEPQTALASGPDGLADIRTITAQAPDYLAEEGWIMLEHGYVQGPAVRELLTGRGFDRVVTHPDFSGLDRVTVGRWSDGLRGGMRNA